MYKYNIFTEIKCYTSMYNFIIKGDILANFIIREDTKANGKCRLTASLRNPLPLIVHVFTGIKKGNPYPKLMNQW